MPDETQEATITNSGAPYAILIAGPTASGKSALAVAVAQALGGVVINADSMQVYRDLAVLTARPGPDDMGGINHELYGFVGAGDAYSVGRYLADAAVHIRAASKRGQVPVIVGGTGLYFRGLLEGLSPVPEIDADVRQRWRDAAEAHGAAYLHEALRRRDPEMAGRLMASDAQRLARALEVLESTGRSLSYWQTLPGESVLEVAACRRIVVEIDRAQLYERCDARFDAMLEGGALFEVARLQAMQLDPSFPIMGALGVRPLIAYLDGKCSKEDAVERAKTETRQYAKRQLTWMRRNMMSWFRISTQEMTRNKAIEVILD